MRLLFALEEVFGRDRLLNVCSDSGHEDLGGGVNSLLYNSYGRSVLVLSSDGELTDDLDEVKRDRTGKGETVRAGRDALLLLRLACEARLVADSRLSSGCWIISLNKSLSHSSLSP